MSSKEHKEIQKNSVFEKKTKNNNYKKGDLKKAMLK